MRSADALLPKGLLLLVLLCGLVAPATAELSAQHVREAASAVAADPLMPGTETKKTLRFKPDPDETKTRKEAEAQPAQWWLDLLTNLSSGLRLALWLLGAGLLLWVLLRLRSWLGDRAVVGAAMSPLPTHVGTLDIRPDSLPADIGEAAWRLWQGGESRGALSLLYRGALSSLVHTHGVPIRAASTEGECLQLAASHLAPPAQVFLAQLVRGWQTVAYAQRPLADEAVADLCHGFGSQLGRPQ